MLLLMMRCVAVAAASPSAATQQRNYDYIKRKFNCLFLLLQFSANFGEANGFLIVNDIILILKNIS